MQYNLIGAGRVGKNIAKALAQNPSLNLNAVCNSTLQSAQKACEALGFGTPVARLADLSQADLTWITCSDDLIESIAYTLAEQGILKPGSLVVHCSGVLSSASLLPLQQCGLSIASMHPLKSFKADLVDARAFTGVYCALEGDKKACDWLAATFQRLGAHLIPMQPEAKIAYHTAASIASNYLITLAASSAHLLNQAGIVEEQGHAMLCNLMQNTLDNLKKTPQIAEALTGPLMRGDVNTLELHVQAISDPKIKMLYKSAGLATLPLTQLDSEKYQQIEALLSE